MEGVHNARKVCIGRVKFNSECQEEYCESLEESIEEHTVVQ